jgi:hypothetical protein
MISKLNKDLELSHSDEEKYSFGLKPVDAEGSDDGSKPTTVYEQLDPIKRIAIKFKNKSDSLDLVRMLVINLGTELGEFSIDDFQRLLTECEIDKDKVDEYLDKLKELTIIYEPKPGIFRLVEE